MTQTPTEYIVTKEKRTQAFATIKKGKMTIIIDGKKITQEQLDRLYPLPDTIRAKVNMDTSPDWRQRL